MYSRWNGSQKYFNNHPTNFRFFDFKSKLNNLKDCKIGRQSNLFKQKIKTIMDSKADQAQSGNSDSLDPLSNSNSFSSTNLSEMCLPTTNLQVDSNSNVNVEDLLEENDKCLFIKIYLSSKALMVLIFYIFFNVYFIKYQIYFNIENSESSTK